MQLMEGGFRRSTGYEIEIALLLAYKNQNKKSPAYNKAGLSDIQL